MTKVCQKRNKLLIKAVRPNSYVKSKLKVVKNCLQLLRINCIVSLVNIKNNLLKGE